MKYMILIVLFLCTITTSLLHNAYNKKFDNIRLKTSLFGSNDGLLFDMNYISNELKKNMVGLGMPKVYPPGKDGDEWLLWFHGRDDKFSNDIVKLSTGRIFFATSKDGINNWKMDPDNPILNPSKEAGDWFYFDSEHVGLGDVIKPGMKAQSKFATQDGVFLMYIFGGNNEAQMLNNDIKMRGMKMEIGVAVSQDGSHWSRVEGPSARGAIVEVGSKDEFDSAFIGWPNVMEVNSEYWMYYHTYNPITKTFSIGRAVAKDGTLKWTKKGQVFTAGAPDKFDGRGVSRRHTARMADGSYRMWYEGVSKDNIHSIGVATSLDGTNWERLSTDSVFTPSSDPEAWDAGGVGSPHLVWLNEKRRWRMYYVGTALNNSEKAAFGIAESTDENGLDWIRMSTDFQ